MLKRTVKSCGSDASTPASSFTEASRPDRARTKPYPETTVTKEPDRRGEHEVSRKTIARGMPGLLRCDRGDYARVLVLFCTRGCGCIGHPAFPAPSVFSGPKDSCTTRAPHAARLRSCICCLRIESRLCRWRVPQLLFPPPLWGRVREGVAA